MTEAKFGEDPQGEKKSTYFFIFSCDESVRQEWIE